MYSQFSERLHARVHLPKCKKTIHLFCFKTIMNDVYDEGLLIVHVFGIHKTVNGQQQVFKGLPKWVLLFATDKNYFSQCNHCNVKFFLQLSLNFDSTNDNNWLESLCVRNLRCWQNLTCISFKKTITKPDRCNLNPLQCSSFKPGLKASNLFHKWRLF